MVSAKYVINPKEGGEKKADDRTNPFRWMIDGFSTIANQGAATYYSGSFTACGFSWKLRLESVLEEDGEKYMGLYLSHDDADSKNPVIKAIYKLFIYDQLHAEHVQKEGDNTVNTELLAILQHMFIYLMKEGLVFLFLNLLVVELFIMLYIFIIYVGEDYFHSKSHDGFCCKIALNKFNSSKSGLLVNDCCIFGAEVLEAFACKLDKEGIHESLSLKKDLTARIYTWVIKDVSKSKDRLLSETVAAGGYNWRISLYPNLASFKDFFAMFLIMDNASNLGSKTRVYVDFSFCLLDQHNAKHWKRSESANWGWRDFLSWNDVQDPSRGFLRNETCIVEASIVVLGVDIIA
ncbi:hypothetical protein ZIOFF_045530 [Zingiber officinale]|uniref:MATH domain-containing protein n=1 Tax=Zingiber officinale TaxID=94328 RepID=A0A8J5G162_ZINOF|nr:hypothetical protein ZIOFF_045530 [Zingiber officinale]